MTSEQNAVLQMYDTVKTTCEHHKEDWDPYPIFSERYGPFLELLPKVTAALARQETSSTGATELKSSTRGQLIKLMLHIANIITLHAQNTNNPMLREEAYMSRSDMERAAGKTLTGHGLKLQDLITKHAAVLLPLGLTAALTTEFNTTLAAYNELLSEPRHLIYESARGTEELEKLINEGNALLDKLDVAAAVVGYEKEDFYREYLMARTIVDAGSNTRALTVTVLDKENAEPLQYAQALIEPGGISKESGEKGMFYVQNLQEGNYTLEVKKLGYLTQNVSFALDSRGGVQLEVRLERGSPA